MNVCAQRGTAFRNALQRCEDEWALREAGEPAGTDRYDEVLERTHFEKLRAEMDRSGKGMDCNEKEMDRIEQQMLGKISLSELDKKCALVLF